MGELHELVNIQAFARLFDILAVSGPIVGLCVGGALGSRTHSTRRGSVYGLMWGSLGVLNWLLWRAYNLLTDRNGLDSVKNLVVNLALFILVGVVIGISAARIQNRLRLPDGSSAKQSDDPERST